MTRSHQRLFIAYSLPIFPGAPTARLRRRCPFGRPCNIPSFKVLRSDSPLILRSDLWLSLGSGWAGGLACSLDSYAASLVLRCSNFRGLCGSVPGPARIPRRWLCACPRSSHPTRHRVKCCRNRIEFVVASAGTTGLLRSIIGDTRLTGDGLCWSLKWVSQPPSVATSGAVTSDPARHIAVTALTSNQQSSGCEPRQQTVSHRATAADRLTTPAGMELSGYWRQLAHPPSRERKRLCLTAEDL
jgi:hypothetical protein